MNTNIIILLLILIPILYILYTSYHTEKSTINSNDDTNIKTIPCGVLSSLTIKKCDKKDEKDICSSCQCSSDPSIIENCMTCTEVNDQNKYIVPLLSKEDCKDPFVFDDNTKKCQLKNGKYCLPVKISTKDSNSPENIHGIYNTKFISKLKNAFLCALVLLFAEGGLTINILYNKVRITMTNNKFKIKLIIPF